jgi:hypothetical protein
MYFQHVLLTFVSLDIQEDIQEEPNCSYDRLNIHDNSSTNATSTYCGTTTPVEPIKSTGQFVDITFTSDASVGGNGFKLLWEIEIDNELGKI